MRVRDMALSLALIGVAAGHAYPQSLETGERIYMLARGELGITETPGPKTTPRIAEYWRVAGYDLGDDVSWCSGFVMALAILADADISGATPASRSWLSVGAAVHDPQPGDVVVFWRGSRWGRSGHVGIFVRETPSRVYVIGGNQGFEGAVTETSFPRERVLGIRRLMAR